MSSPRGLVACGMVGIVVDAAASVAVGEDGGVGWVGCGWMREEEGEWRGGFWTFRYMLNERKALLCVEHI